MNTAYKVLGFTKKGIASWTHMSCCIVDTLISSNAYDTIGISYENVSEAEFLDAVKIDYYELMLYMVK